jgi:putative Mn2+ efflux pump MntP
VHEIVAAVKALRHSEHATEEAAVEKFAPLGLAGVVVQGVATSIDALLIGVSFAAMGAQIFVSAGLIALTTFICCLAALPLGRRFGILLGEKAQVVGGVVLILIGIKACFF